MTSTAPPMCLWCTRWDDRTLTCSAYPEGVPEAVLYGGADHRLPLPGDRGLLFDPTGDAATEAVTVVYGAEPTVYRGAWPNPEDVSAWPEPPPEVAPGPTVDTL